MGRSRAHVDFFASSFFRYSVDVDNSPRSIRAKSSLYKTDARRSDREDEIPSRIKKFKLAQVHLIQLSVTYKF